MLTLVLAESAIELVPRQLISHPAIRASARRKMRPPEELILDQNYHHAAIHRLGKSKDEQRRGRPDIVHLSLLTALGSPLNLEGQLKTYVHTLTDRIITINPQARLPRQTDRFVSLLEQLYATGFVPPTGERLLS
ncbi:MAG TPA: hypothetical protein VE177_03810, partial [Candidatus Binatus sp.]|nr:hypothetical protein [Candidatus Binatus sp.]